MSTVRSGRTGRIIPCCWAECDRHGLTEYEIRVHERDRAGRVIKITHYVFCSERHRLYYANGSTAYGQLPAGMRTTDGHVTAQPIRGGQP